MLNYATAIYVADTCEKTAQEQSQILLKYIDSEKPYRIYYEKKGNRIYYKNRPALQMLIEDVKNRCVDRILVIDLEVFFGSAGDAAGIYDELKKIDGLELVDLPLILSLEKAVEKQRNELEMNMAFSVAYEAFIDKYRPRPKYKYFEKECLIYVFFTQGDIVGLNDKIAACTALAKPGSKIRYIIDDLTNKDAEHLGWFDVITAVEQDEIDTLIVYELGSVANELDEYNENLLLLNEHNVELKNVIDVDNPAMTTISSAGFGFWDWLGI